MIFTQYGSLFGIYFYTLLIIPAVLLHFLGRKTKYYGCFITVPIIFCIMGIHSSQFKSFLAVILYEFILIIGYYFYCKRAKSEFTYFVVFILSILPIIFVKFNIPIYGHFWGFIGISYMSFRIWELIIEIHDGHIKNMSLLDLFYYVTFFPTLSSGPIDSYNRFCNNINHSISVKEYRNDFFIFGIKKIAKGIFYKFAMSYFINTYIILKIPEDKTIWTFVIYAYAYTFYLFYDFAGYSNLAIGTGYLLGVKVPENFNKPFLAHNMKEFWERWHMSLSNWFGKNVYSRFVLNTLRNGTFKNKKVASRCGNIITMLLMGVWHGIQLHYIIYGLYEGIMLVLTDIYQKSDCYKKFRKKKSYSWLSRVICFQIIAFGMLLFSGYLFE